MILKEIIFVLKDIPDEDVYNNLYETVRKMGGVIRVDIFKKSGVLKVVYDTASTTIDKISTRVYSIVGEVEKIVERLCVLKTSDEIKNYKFNLWRSFVFLCALIIFYFSEKFNANTYISFLMFFALSLWFLRDLGRRFVFKKKLNIYTLTFFLVIIFVLYSGLKIFLPSYFQSASISFYSVFISLFFIVSGFELTGYAVLKNYLSYFSTTSFMPGFLRVMKDEKENYLPAYEIKKGDRVILSSTNFVCFDGSILDGKARVDESLIRNSSFYVNKKKGDKIISGSFIIDGELKVRVDNHPQNSFFYKRVEKISSIIINAQLFVNSIYTIADRYIRFIPVLSLLYIILSHSGFFNFSSIESLFIFFFLSYPYSVWVVFPLVYFFSLSSTAKNGFLVKNISAFELVSSADTVAFFSIDGIDERTIVSLKESGLRTILLVSDKLGEDKIYKYFDFFRDSLSSDEKLGFILKFKISGAKIIGVGLSLEDFDALSECDVKILTKKHPQSFSFPSDIIFLKNEFEVVKKLKRYSTFIINLISQSVRYASFIHIFIIPFLFGVVNRYFSFNFESYLISVVIIMVMFTILNSVRVYFLKSYT